MGTRQRILVTVLLLVCSLTIAGAATTSAGPQMANLLRPGSGPTLTAHHPGWGGNCRFVANLARTACNSDALDDFFTTRANCVYLSDSDEAAECREEALEEYYEALAECRARRQARREVCDLLDEDKYDPEIEPDLFLSPDQIANNPNPYFPLVPGNTWVYENEEETITVTVLEETFEIEGIECVVVQDLVSLTETGELIEDTLDWYSQDLEGNVWYMGEIAKNYEDGVLTDLDGSWRTGEEYAKPGTLLLSLPHPGQAYRQEYLLREAEDLAEVLSLSASASSEFVDCEGQCLQTLEFTPMEPEVAEHKFYLAGVGLILEVDLENGDRTELVDFIEAGSE